MPRRRDLLDLPPTRVVSRDEFLGHGEYRDVGSMWDYQSGEHVTVLGPTGSGKTHLAYGLLEATVSPRLPAVVMVMKPRDETVQAWSRRIGLRRTNGWPPIGNPFDQRTTGWTVWPRHRFDPETDDAMMHNVFRKAILDSYRKGRRILFADEAAGLAGELALERELKTVWMRGRSMDCGLWAASQRPVEIPLHAYSQAHHLFLAHDPDYRTRQRYAEIGGVDPAIVLRDTAELPRWHFLYIRREGQRRVIITP